ncbi:universal stress protein [Alteromonas sp. C1M14]|uniref:universal stress protein n=1 Tax=Alteromonas sp. C1M14 TaxID=2841567 RepID=UPI001C08524A|nr:universal stress protein [Alteromonas sp. C1M14]MBU2977739.1 universal stress protein [Alteromonas sp. C1M14]
MKGHFKNILCVLHDTNEQEALVAQAKHIAKKHQAKLTVLLVLDELPPNANMIMQSFEYLESQSTLSQTAQSWMDDKVAQWSANYPVKGEIAIGHLYLEVIRHVVSNQYDLVVKFTENQLTTSITGTEDRNLLRKCPCPVWILHRTQSRKYKQVVAAIDINYHYPQHEVQIRKQLALDVLSYASRIALLEYAQLHVVHVFDAVPENILRHGFISVNEHALQNDLQGIQGEREAELNRLLGVLRLELGDEAYEYLKPQCHLVHGYPRKLIAQTAKACEADVIVMGTLSRLGVPGYIMGGTAEETIEQLECAVVGLKPEGFVTPVRLANEND